MTLLAVVAFACVARDLVVTFRAHSVEPQREWTGRESDEELVPREEREEGDEEVRAPPAPPVEDDLGGEITIPERLKDAYNFIRTQRISVLSAPSRCARNVILSAKKDRWALGWLQHGMYWDAGGAFFLHRGNKPATLPINNFLLPWDSQSVLKRHTWGKCAVVGNGGVMRLEPHFGPYIDKHDVVVRINHAPTGLMVGNRTDVRVLSRLWAHRYGGTHLKDHGVLGDGGGAGLGGVGGSIDGYGADEHEKIHLIPDDGSDDDEREHAFNPEEATLGDHYLPLEEDIVLVAAHPKAKGATSTFVELDQALKDANRFDVELLRSRQEFYDATARHLKQFQACMNKHRTQFAGDVQPSTGLQSVLLFSGVCDQINLYGFGPVQNKRKFWMKYYKRHSERGMGSESFNLELEYAFLTGLTELQPKTNHLVMCRAGDHLGHKSPCFLIERGGRIAA